MNIPSLAPANGRVTAATTESACHVLQFPGDRVKPFEPPPLLEPGHRYRDGEVTVDGRHRYCTGCDVFWRVDRGCDHTEQERRGPRYWQLVIFTDGFRNLIMPGTWSVAKVLRKMKAAYPRAKVADLALKAVRS